MSRKGLTLRRNLPILGYMKKPVIGITADVESAVKGESSLETLYSVKKAYVSAVEKSGGVPVILPVVDSPRVLKAYMETIDGLLLTGGYFDIDPKLYGEKKHPLCGELKPDRTKMELLLFKQAMKLKVPTLGVCGGMQAINVELGGTLYQHIPAQVKGALPHEQKPVPATKATHSVTFEKGTLLKKLAGSKPIKVNSTHHQGVKDVGKDLKVCAIAKDGIVEAFEYEGDHFIVGVQWHPELLFDKSEFSRRLYKKFVKEAGVARIIIS